MSTQKGRSVLVLPRLVLSDAVYPSSTSHFSRFFTFYMFQSKIVLTWNQKFSSPSSFASFSSPPPAIEQTFLHTVPPPQCSPASKCSTSSLFPSTHAANSHSQCTSLQTLSFDKRAVSHVLLLLLLPAVRSRPASTSLIAFFI